jgi:osmoprotectant transport system substrate-binding protein
LVSRFNVLAALLIAVTLPACGGDAAPPTLPAADEAIRIGAFNFPESEMLAEMYAQVLEDAGLPVHRVGVIGSREIVEPALELGIVDLVPEYLGSLLEFVNLGAGAATADTVASLAHLRAELADRGLVALEPAPAQDRNALVVRKAFAAEHAIRVTSDLVPMAADLTFGGPPECPERYFCLAGLEERYGLGFGAFVPLPSNQVVVGALQTGEIDVGLLFSTDPALADERLVVLADDGGLQPAENIVPVVRQEALDRWGPRLAAALDAVSAELDTVDVVTLNFDAQAAGGQAPALRSVVAAWLAGDVVSE